MMPPLFYNDYAVILENNSISMEHEEKSRGKELSGVGANGKRVCEPPAYSDIGDS